MARRESTIRETTTSNDSTNIARRLLDRTARKLRRSADNRERRVFADGYKAASRVVAAAARKLR